MRYLGGLADEFCLSVTLWKPALGVIGAKFEDESTVSKVELLHKIDAGGGDVLIERLLHLFALHVTVHSIHLRTTFPSRLLNPSILSSTCIKNSFQCVPEHLDRYSHFSTNSIDDLKISSVVTNDKGYIFSVNLFLHSNSPNNSQPVNPSPTHLLLVSQECKGSLGVRAQAGNALNS